MLQNHNDGTNTAHLVYGSHKKDQQIVSYIQMRSLCGVVIVDLNKAKTYAQLPNTAKLLRYNPARTATSFTNESIDATVRKVGTFNWYEYTHKECKNHKPNNCASV